MELKRFYVQCFGLFRLSLEDSSSMEDEDLGFDAINPDDVLNDPELLAELRNLGWGHHDVAEQLPIPKPPRPSSIKATGVSSGGNQIEQEDEEYGASEGALNETDLQDPELMQMYEQLSDEVSGKKAAPKSYSPPREVPKPAVQAPTRPISGSEAGVSAEEAKKRAIEAKRAGNTDEALYWFRIAKAQGVVPSGGGSGSRMAPSSVQSPARASLSPEVTAASLAYDPNFNPLEKALMEASNKALQEAKALRDKDASKAVVKMREYKQYENELVTLRARKTVAGAIAPAFTWQIVQKKISLERLEIAEQDLFVQVTGVYEIDALLAEHKSKELFAEVTFGGTGKEVLAQSTTSTVRYDSGSKSAVFNLTATWPGLIKRSKLTQNSLLRKKITVRLQAQGSGMLWRSAPKDLAIAVVPLQELATQSEWTGKAPLFGIAVGEDGALKKSSKALGGYLQMTLRVRKPITGPEVQIVEERQLVLAPWPPLVTPTLPPAAPAPVVSTNNALKEAATVATSAAPTAVPSTSGATSALAGAVQLTDREKADPEAVDFLESNDVLEAEIASVTAALSAPGSASDEDAHFMHTLRLQLLQAKLQALVMQVENETLSLPDYLDKLRQRVQRDQVLARYLAKEVQSEDPEEVQECRLKAARVLRRVKVMQQEIENAEASLSAADEEEEA